MKIYKSIQIKKFYSKKKLFEKCISIFKRETGKRSVMITGGSTYKDFYLRLSAEKIDWHNINLILTDERLTHSENLQNYSIIKNYLLNRIKFKKPKIFFNVNNYNFKKKFLFINKLEKKFLRLLKTQLIFLAVGSDGHIASIFKHKPKMISKKKIFIISKKKNESFFRVSFNFNFFCYGKRIIIALFGKNKKKIIKMILNKNHNSSYPIFRLLRDSKSNIKIYYV